MKKILLALVVLAIFIIAFLLFPRRSIDITAEPSQSPEVRESPIPNTSLDLPAPTAQTPDMPDNIEKAEKDIVGEWQSLDDEEYKIEFKSDMTFSEEYINNPETGTTGMWSTATKTELTGLPGLGELEEGMFLVVILSSNPEPSYYQLMGLKSGSLSMLNLSTNNLLRFEKTN